MSAIIMLFVVLLIALVQMLIICLVLYFVFYVVAGGIRAFLDTIGGKGRRS